MDLSQPQSDAWHYLHDEEHTEVLFGGGAGGGKSMLGCLWQITRRIQHPGTRGLICRKGLKSIRESTLITFFDVATRLGYRAGIDYVFNATYMTITFNNASDKNPASIIVFKDLDWEPSDPNYERLGSSEYTDCFIDEAGEVTEKAFDIVNSRLRWMVKKGTAIPISKILLTCNPNHNWIRSKYIKKKDELVIRKPYQVYVRSLLTDNPDKAFVATYKQQLERMSSVYDIARLLYGDWDVTEKTGGEVLKQFDADKHIGKAPYNPALPLHLSFDKNLNPYFPCGFFQVQGLNLRMVDEIAATHPNNSTTWMCREIIRRYPAHNTGMFIYGDATAQADDVTREKGHNMFRLLMDGLSKYHPTLRVGRGNPSVVMSLNFFNSVLEKEEGGINFLMDEHCFTARRDFENAKEDAEGGIDKRTVRDPKTGVSSQPFGHFVDLARYLLVYIYQSAYGKYQSGGVPRQITKGKRVSRGGY